MIKECEKNPSRAFELLFQVFGSNPANIQNTVQKIGKRLQQKIMSGAIRPQEIAREAEELMKEFASNSNFVEMMEGIKGAFGFEDMDLARQAGKEGSARLAMVRERLKKKASEKEARKSNIIAVPNSSLEQADAIAAMLLNEESNSKSKNNKGNGKEKGTAKGVKK
jgi:predicted transcriptional regulator